MFKKIFTEQQVSYFFHIAIIINNIGLLSDVIVYHYFPEYECFKVLNKNLSSLSIFIVCCIFVSQSLFIFIKHHHHLITQYRLVAMTLEICISVFFVLLLTINNDLQEEFLIFCSTASRMNGDYTISIILVGLVVMLLINFYHSLKTPYEAINSVTVPKMLRSIARLVIQKYCIMLCFFGGIFHYEKMHTFAADFIAHTKSCIDIDSTILVILIPVGWISIGLYYLYRHAQQKKTKITS